MKSDIRSLCLAALLGLPLMPAWEARGGDVLVNSSFEQGLQSWTLASHAQGQARSQPTTDSLAGFRACRLQMTSPTKAGWLTLEQRIPADRVQAGERVVLKAYVRGNRQSAAAKASIGFRYTRANAAPREGSSVPLSLAVPGRWQLLTTAFEVPAGLQDLVVFLRCEGSTIDLIADALTAYAYPDVWWHQMFSMSFDGHGNFVAPHLDTLNTRAASLGPMGYHGIWDADFSRDMGWMRGHLAAFEKHPQVRKVMYIEGCTSTKVIYHSGPKGNIQYTSGYLHLLNDPATRASVARHFGDGGKTGWLGDWQFMNQNRCQNPDFERGLASWRPHRGGVTITDARGHKGRHSCRLEPGDRSNPDARFLSQEIPDLNPLKHMPGDRLRVQAYVRLEAPPPPGKGAFLQVEFHDAQGAALLRANTAPGGVSGTWTLLECTTAIPERTESATIGLCADSLPGAVWFDDVSVRYAYTLRTGGGRPMPTAADLGLPDFVHPLDGSEVTTEQTFWDTRRTAPLIGADRGRIEKYAELSDADARSIRLDKLSRREDGRWLVESGADMLYDRQYAAYQVGKARRAMQVFAPDMIHYDDWDLRSPSAMNGRADHFVAVFRAYVERHFRDEDYRACGIDKAHLATFDVLHYLVHPPWRSAYQGAGDGPLWRCACDGRWLSDKIWRAYQIAVVESRRESMAYIYRENKRLGRELLGREVPMVANIIPTLSASFLQQGHVEMPNFEWPLFKTFGQFPKPLGFYPQARIGIGPRMAAKISTTGHAIVNPYVPPAYSGWSGNGFDKRQYETLHKVIYFDLVANRGIPAFALAWDGGYSPGSMHSAGQLHAFLNATADVVSKREYVADVGLAGSAWSQIAAQPPFGGWKHEVAHRYLAEFLGWSQYLSASRDFWQWDVVPFDHVALDDLARFKLVILPSVLVVSPEQLAVLEQYVQLGGRLLITGESGTVQGVEKFLMPCPKNVCADLARRFPRSVRFTSRKPGLDYHMTGANTAELRRLMQESGLTGPVLSATGAPEHVGIYLSESRVKPEELTVDLVNYNYDLPHDRMTPVAATDFRVQIRAKHLAALEHLAIEAIGYDEKAPHNTARHPLDEAALSFAAGTWTLRVPPFAHYQILRITPGR